MPMPIRQFEPRRAVEIIAPSYGSGYRLGDRLVLTAAHLLGEKDSDCEIRDKRSFGKMAAKVVWKAEGLDIALIELPAGIAGVGPVTLGRLPEEKTGEKLAFQMYGYPLWAQTLREQGRAAGGRQIEGTIYLSDRSPDRLLVLEAERLPPEATIAKSEWAGASGAAIVCDGLVIAVQSQHQNPSRPASLEASPLSIVYADERWQKLLEKHGINPEPEIAHVQALGLTLNRQAALASAQTTAMLIVDLMRMLYVMSNHEARLANMSRYSVFVDMANNHLSEMRSQAARFATQMPSDFLNLSAEIERNCAWVYGQLKGPPDVTQDIERCYKIMHRTASLTFKFCLDAIPEIFSTVVRDVDDAMAKLSPPESPKNVDLFRIRLNAQTQLLDNLKSNPDNIRTIAHDVSQQFALHYFVIDYQLLNAIQPTA
jgi:hypothetical protein